MPRFKIKYFDSATLSSQDRKRVLTAFLLALLTALSGLFPMIILRRLFYNIATTESTQTALLLIPAVTIPFLCHGLMSVYCHKFAFDVVHSIRRNILRYTKSIGSDWVTQNAPNLKKLTLDDCADVETSIAHTLPDVIISLATLLINTAFLLFLSPLITLASLALLPVALLALRRIGSTAASNGRAWYQADLSINKNIMACISGLMTLRVFNRPPSSLPPLTSALTQLSTLATDMTRHSRGSYVLSFICLGANFLVVLPTALVLHHAQHLTLPDTLCAVLLGSGLTIPLQRLIFAANTLPRLRATLMRLEDLKAQHSIIKPYQSLTFSNETGFALSFENVSYTNHRQNTNNTTSEGAILTALNITFPAGKVTGIVGASGAGKSTLLQLAAGIIPPSSGRILLGQQDQTQQDLSSLTPQITGQLICPVFQQPFLLGPSLADNLRLGQPDISDADIRDALSACDLTACIERFGLNGSIGRNGARLSGGERQRLAIARALVSRAPIILLDEPTAFIDPEREALIQQALARFLKGRTIVIVAHRLSTIQEADHLIVLQDGHLIAQGRHAELLKSSALYENFAKHQHADGAAA